MRWMQRRTAYVYANHEGNILATITRHALPPVKAKSRQQFLSAMTRLLCGLGASAALLAAPLAHAGFENGGFEDGNFNHWTAKSYTRGTGTPLSVESTVQNTSNTAPILSTNFPPTIPSQLRLLPDTVWNGVTVTPGNPLGGAGITSGDRAQIMGVAGTAPNSITAPNAPNLKLPRWGERTIQVGGIGGRKASSLEQTATMSVADIDPVDGKIHVRFALAPVLDDPNHPATNQPFFFIEVVNETKSKQLFHTFNFSNQPGIPWQKNGDYKYTDWQGFDIAPGNGLMDVGDQITLRIYVSNCSDGGADHTAVVYLDAVGAFMPGLTVAATGPTTTKPGEDITYTYNYVNNSGVYALGSKIYVAAPIVAGKQAGADPAGSAPQETTFVGTPVGPDGAACDGPHTGSGTSPYKRGDYYICNAGDLNNGASGSFDVTFTVPSTAPTTGPYNLINNGDYNIYADSVSPYVGPLVQTGITGSGTTLVDLGVTIDNGGHVSYAVGDAVEYSVTVTNHGATTAQGDASQTLKGVGTCAQLTQIPASATCTDSGGAAVVTFSTASLAAGASANFTIKGIAQAAGTPANALVTVTPAGGAIDSNTANNTTGMNTPVGTSLHNVTANASGSGQGHILAVPAPLACGNGTTACTSTGTTKPVAQGDEVRLTPIAHPGSIFKDWTGCDSVTAANICVVTMGTSDITATAEFAPSWIVTPAVNGGHGSAGAVKQVEDGQSATLSFTPDAGYYTVIETNGCAPATGALNGNDYTVTPVTASCTVTAKFEPVAPGSSVNLTGTVTGGGGSITPPGTTVIAKGGSLTYTAIPTAPGNVAVFGGTCEGVRNGNTLAVTNAQADCTVDVRFVAPASAITVTTTVPGGGGSVSTSGQNAVGETVLAVGDTRVWALTPTVAGTPPRILPGATCTGNLSTTAPYTYTVTNASADCVVAFAFGAAITPASIPTLSEWGLIILSALMGLLMLGMQRRQAG